MRAIEYRTGILVAFLLGFCLAANADNAAPPATDAARVVTVVGTAAVGKKRLEVGENVHVGDRIETGRASSVKLLLADRSIVDISANSAFTVSAFAPRSGGDRDLDLDVEFGKVRASVNRKLEGKGHIQLHTKASVLAVRGTEFVVTASRDGNAAQQVVVVSGRVQVSAISGPNSVFVAAGSQWENAAHAAGAPAVWNTQVHPLAAQQLNAVLASARTDDNSFYRAIVVGNVGGDAHVSGGRTIEAATTLAAPPVHPGANQPAQPTELPPSPVPGSQGSSALTGIQTISNGTLAPQPPPGYYASPAATQGVQIRIH